MPSLFERIRNVFRNELAVPAPQKTAQQLELESQEAQEKMDEGFRMGAASVITQVAEYLQEVRPMLVFDWAHELQHDHKRAEPQTHTVINARNAAVLASQNDLARFLRDYSKENGLAPELIPEVLDLQSEKRAAHQEAAYLEELEWVQDLDPSNHVGGNAYERVVPAVAESAEEHEISNSYERDYDVREYPYADGFGIPMTKEQMLDYEEGRYGMPMSEEQVLPSRSEEPEKVLGVLHKEMTEFLGSDLLAQNFVTQMKSAYPDLSPSQLLHDSRYITSNFDPEQLKYELLRPNGYLVDLRQFPPLPSTETKSHSAEVSANRYEYLDVAIQQLSHASSAITAREVSQPWTVSQPQQSVFAQPVRAQQVAVETPEVQRDFGVSL